MLPPPTLLPPPVVTPAPIVAWTPLRWFYAAVILGIILVIIAYILIFVLPGNKGDKGDKGADGLKGDTGDKGQTGDTGAQGKKGDQGDPGKVQGISGKTNQVIVTPTGGGNFALSTPQDIAPSSDVGFKSLLFTGDAFSTPMASNEVATFPVTMSNIWGGAPIILQATVTRQNGEVTMHIPGHFDTTTVASHSIIINGIPTRFAPPGQRYFILQGYANGAGRSISAFIDVNGWEIFGDNTFNGNGWPIGTNVGFYDFCATWLTV